MLFTFVNFVSPSCAKIIISLFVFKFVLCLQLVHASTIFTKSCTLSFKFYTEEHFALQNAAASNIVLTLTDSACLWELAGYLRYLLKTWINIGNIDSWYNWL